MSTDLIQHAFHGQAVRVVTDEHGDPWFIAADVAAILGYSITPAMTRRLDEDEKGMRPLHTPGGVQQMTVITESGLYSAILGSQVEGAREFKRWVTHDLLPEVRRTGSYALAANTPEQRIALAVIEAQALLAEKDQQIATLTPSAAAWTALADGAGDYSLRDAAQILDRDPSIKTGQNRLGAFLRQIGWIDRKGIPYQNRVDQGLIRSRARAYKHPRTGEQMIGDPQVRVTAKGLGKLHSLLGGSEPLSPSSEVAA